MKTSAISTYLEELQSGDIKGSSEDILSTCAVIKSAKDHLSDEQFRDLRDQSPFTEKVWSKLLQVGMDDRLEGIKSSLPPSYTTIHQIHCLSDEELNKGTHEGHINPKVRRRSSAPVPQCLP